MMNTVIIVFKEGDDYYGGWTVEKVYAELDHIPDVVLQGCYSVEEWEVGGGKVCDWWWRSEFREWLYWDEDTDCKEYCWKRRGT